MTELKAANRGDPIPGLTKAQTNSLRSYIRRKYKVAHSVAGALARAAFVIGKEKDLDPQLLLAVIAIESRYNPFAESAAGAQGLMQVMSRVHGEKLTTIGGGQAAVFNPVVNMQVGAQILADCIKRRGSVTGGLACYVGATGVGDGGYGERVLAERRRIALASGVPVGKP
jgi:soluble lytic murein transglycosylase-like protein